MAISGNAQISTQSGNKIYNFKPLGLKCIDMRKLKDSTYSFKSADGVRLILTISNKTITNTRILNTAGKEVGIINDTNSVARQGLCFVCHMERVENGSNKGGTYKQVCAPVACLDAEGINKSLSTQ